MEWHILLAAVTTAMSLHAVMEPDNLMRKLRRLDVAIKTGKIQELPLKGINTRPKSYAVGISFMLVLTTLAYLVARLIHPSQLAAIKYCVAVAIIAELILMMRLDVYHVEIEKITRSLGRD
jgi:hypothetical protein